MVRETVGQRVVDSLRHPFVLAAEAWPRRGPARVAATLAVPFLAVMALVVVWLLGVVVLSTLGALGAEVVDMEESYAYVRDTVWFVAAGVVTVLLWVLLTAVGRTVAAGRRERHLTGR